jgi:hypothetical protein
MFKRTTLEKEKTGGKYLEIHVMLYGCNKKIKYLDFH